MREIKGVRIKLRLFRVQDLHPLYQMIHHEKILKELYLLPSKDLRLFKKELLRGRKISYNGPPFHWIIADVKTDKPMGAFGLWEIEEDGIVYGNVALWLGRPFWGHGYMRDAMRLATSHAFQTFYYPRIEATALVKNERSRKGLETVGFKLEGCKRHALKKGRQLRDLWIFGLLPHELR